MMLSVKCLTSLRNYNGSLVLIQKIGSAKREKSDKIENTTDKVVKCDESNFRKDRRNVDFNQTDNVRIETWPKPSSSASRWRNTCPTSEPQPKNYDLFKIKVPSSVVPPLPQYAAKPSIECKIKTHCIPAMKPDPTPREPRKPFPWRYVIVTLATMTCLQMFYKTYLWLEAATKETSKIIWRPRPIQRVPHHEKDLPPRVQYLIVGTGPAGMAAYRAIMDNDPEAKVFFITAEDIYPYKRWPLSKYMWWNKEAPDVKDLTYFIDNDMRKMDNLYEMRGPDFMDPVKFYEIEKGPAVGLASGWYVTSVDADKHEVYINTLKGERVIQYERCLLALGSRPKNLDIFKLAPRKIREKVSTLRNIRDLECSFRAVNAARHVTVIGGGPLGCELAYYIGSRKRIIEKENDETPPLEVAHVFKDPGVLGHIVPAYLGEWLAEKIHCQGVTIMNNKQVYDVNMTPDDRLELIMSDGSSLITDYVLVAIGTEPRVDVAESSFLELDEENGGFVVNPEMEARRHLYVAGDAASVYSQIHNCRYRFENHVNAEQCGYKAGMNMTGKWVPCNDLRQMNFKLGRDINVEAFGDVGGSLQTISLFKNCLDGEDAKRYDVYSNDNDTPCYKDSTEYKCRYKKGIVFYMMKETIVGIMFWNVPAFEDRKDVVYEILLAKPTFRDINVIAELLKFSEADSTVVPGDHMEPKLCWKGLVKEW